MLTPDPEDSIYTSTALYANVGPDGIVVFEKHAAWGLNRVPVLIGPAAAVVQVIRTWGALHPDGVTRWFPDVARAWSQGPDDTAAIDLLSAWRVRLIGELARMIEADPGASSADPGAIP